MRNTVCFYFLCVALLGLFSSCNSGRVMSRQNVSYLYEPGSAINYELQTRNDSLYIYLKFEDKNRFGAASSVTDYRMSYAIWTDYSASKMFAADSVPAFQHQFNRQLQEFNFKIPLQGLSGAGLLVLKWQNPENDDAEMMLDIPLPADIRNKHYLFLNPETRKPYFRHYFKLGEQILIQTNAAANTFTVKEFENNFGPARPPMELATPNQPKTISHQTSLPWFADLPVVPLKKGLFQVQFPDQSTTGFLVEENNFPELTTADELIQPLIYLTTSEERGKLYKAADPKAAVDEFWLKIGGSAVTARFLIKTFYGRIEAANKLFSAHKAGWQTDRGMIYLVFGPPEQVYRTNATETWIYTSLENVGSIQFVFQKKQNNFTQNNYELIRNRVYELAWYSTVDKWRNGIINQ